MHAAKTNKKILVSKKELAVIVYDWFQYIALIVNKYIKIVLNQYYEYGKRFKPNSKRQK